MKHVFIVTGSLGAGGIEKVTSKISNYYIEKGYKVTICCLLEGADKVFIPLNKEIRLLFFKGVNDASKNKFLMVRKWIKFIRESFINFKPDFVLAMTLKIGSLCVLARQKMDIRISFRETCDPKSTVRNRLLDSLLCLICRKIDGIIFQTEWEKSCYPKYLQKKGRVVPNPVSCDALWELDSNNKTIVTMGRLENIQKRHDVLLKAFKAFSNQNPDYKLVIYGNGPDKNYLENEKSKLEISDKVIFAGAQKDVHELIKNASMFVLTSDFEGLSNALAEAMIMGMPCISSDWPGANEVVKQDVNGFIYKRQNINELVKYMHQIANSDDLKLRFSNEAKKLKSYFEPNFIIEKYALIIEGE